ncbi:MAG: F0F1 ATP synthase subunit gamma, partial [Chthoniobacterales bacterium]|nr:F0F1 ATP synthase subunit gamma [Chthoniobacterales bacterium]
GALNTNLFREAANFDPAKTVYIVAGRKARQFLSRTRREILADFELKDAPSFPETKAISQFATERFLSGEVDRVSVLYTHFINTINQKPIVQTVFPISDFDVMGAEGEPTAETSAMDPMGGYIFEPTPEAVLDVILPYYVQYEVFQMILDARASEHSARMVAMKNATDNAKQFIKDLTLEYNKMRQASITTELLEISTAQMAVGS